jgi:uncharacterized membrane protein
MNRSTKILAIALAVSVVFNVFFVGFWAARSVRRWHQRSVPDSFVSAIDRVPSVGETWKRHGVLLRQRRESVDAARLAVRNALVAEPFQPEALETALAKLRAETAETQAAFHAALVQIVRELTPEARHRLAESRWLEQLDQPRPARGR